MCSVTTISTFSSYGFVRMTSSELRPFTTYAECKDMVQEQLKRLGKKSEFTFVKYELPSWSASVAQLVELTDLPRWLCW